MYLDSAFTVTPHLLDPIKTFLVNKDDSDTNPDLLTVPPHHKYQHRPKYGEGWTADMPFAKISEKRLAKTISIAVCVGLMRQYGPDIQLMFVWFTDYLNDGAIYNNKEKTILQVKIDFYLLGGS